MAGWSCSKTLMVSLYWLLIHIIGIRSKLATIIETSIYRAIWVNSSRYLCYFSMEDEITPQVDLLQSYAQMISSESQWDLVSSREPKWDLVRPESSNELIKTAAAAYPTILLRGFWFKKIWSILFCVLYTQQRPMYTYGQNLAGFIIRAK